MGLIKSEWLLSLFVDIITPWTAITMKVGAFSEIAPLPYSAVKMLVIIILVKPISY